jgi:hypothetical protein
MPRTYPREAAKKQRRHKQRLIYRELARKHKSAQPDAQGQAKHTG